MAEANALVVALAILERPRSARLAQVARLPAGVTFLLEIAAGEAQALSKAEELTGRSATTLKMAAGFFIEQILLHPGGDSYRVLGCDRGTSIGELRRNMALIMRWLHPDVASNGSSENQLDKSLFANRVTRAWETIKTEERRTAYDTSLAARESKSSGAAADSKAAAENVSRARRVYAGPGGINRRTKKLVMQRLEPEGFWSRLRLFLGGR
jgi:hypothetical protein